MAVLSVPTTPQHTCNDLITDKMCTPSSTEMYRVANFGDPDTYPGTFGDYTHDKIEVVSSEEESGASVETLEVEKT